MPSRLRTVKDDLYEELLNITAANGYNLTPYQVVRSLRHPADIQNFPEIGIEVGFERLAIEDSAFGVFDSFAPVVIAIAVRAESDLTDDPVLREAAFEDARHDLKRFMAATIRKYLNIKNHTWNISPLQPDMRFGALIGEGMPANVALVGCEFEVQIRSMDEEFEGIDSYLFDSVQSLFDSTQIFFDREN